MKEIILKPIKEDPADYDRLEALLKQMFRREIYLPLIKEFKRKPDVLTNSSTDDLIDAIVSGRIQYDGGQFKGQLNATLTREFRRLGAKWDRRQGSFSIPLPSLPPELRQAIARSESRFSTLMARVDKKLAGFMPAQIADQVKIKDFFDTTLWKLDKEVKGSLKGITVSPTLTDHARDVIAEEYTLNLDKYIQEFTVKEVVRLREQMEANVMAGQRYEGMVKTIQESYGVTERKAKFLARQETGLMMAKFKEVRYADAGVNTYIWRCVAGTKLHPVRPSHKRLDGKKFRYDDPPITSEVGEPVRRNNPGEDYNCRCFSMPVVKLGK